MVAYLKKGDITRKLLLSIMHDILLRFPLNMEQLNETTNAV